MIDGSMIALIGVIGFILIAFTIIGGAILYRFDSLRFKSDTNIKTDLHNGKLDFNSSIEVDGNKNAKKDSGFASETKPLSSNNK